MLFYNLIHFINRLSRIFLLTLSAVLKIKIILSNDKIKTKLQKNITCDLLHKCE